MSALPLDVFACPLQGTRLIEASAGTGKTWNICGLYLRLVLEQGMEVQQVLVVTFTNAATAELRERIRERLAQVLRRLDGSARDADAFTEPLLARLRSAGVGDEAARARLVQALRHFDEAAIFTIHGFCKRALDEAPFAAGLPLRQELITDDAELRAEVANNFWRRHVAGASLAPELAAHLLRQKESPARYASLLKRHAAKPLSRVLWPEAAAEGPIDTAEYRAAHALARDLWRRDRGQIVGCIVRGLDSLNGTSYKQASIEAGARQWDDVLASDDAASTPPVGDKLALFTRTKLRPKAKKPPCEQHPFFDAAEALLQAWSPLQARLEAARWRLLERLAGEGPARVRALKRERRLVAFDDMLFNLHERLAAPDGGTLAHALRRRYPAALIDEFQDTDPLQFSIFRGIYGEHGPLLYLVGDPKQAIYSFRNADLHTYLRARDLAQAEYTLVENQRSTKELIAALNALFTANDRAFMLEGLRYHDVSLGAKPRPVLADRTAPRAPLQLWKLPTLADGAPVAKAEAKRASAKACAAEIARLLGAAQGGEVTLDGRALAAGDIAVLVRSHSQGSAMRQALAVLGVGSVELSQASIFQSPDAEEVERVLLAVLQPGRDPLLRAALATEMLGLDAAAIESLEEAATLGFMERSARYLATWVNRGIGPMLRELMETEGVAARMLARGDGERRMTNLRHLLELLHEAAAQHDSPDALLQWLQRQRREDTGNQDATQLRLESDRNLVQIVTVHKSKGLEYPIVFCPMLWDGHPGPKGDSLGCEYHDDHGEPVIDYREVEGPEKDGIRDRMDLERAAERLRLIYVALTRAVHRCYLVVGPYTAKVGRNALTYECTRNPLNWLVAGQGVDRRDWIRNKVEVATVLAAWETFAAANASHVGLAELPAGSGVPLETGHEDEAQDAAAPLPLAMPAGWRIASYSGLAHGARADTAAVDHDLRAARGARPGPTPPDIAEDDILRFPRGARAGESLHAVFERADFADRSQWPEAIAAALRARPPEAGGATSPQHAAMAHRMLADVTSTPLAQGLVLSRIDRYKRLDELEFNLSAPALDTAKIDQALRRHGYGGPALARQSLQGYLRGFIDLVFEHEGRMHLLDWKSNYLGHGASSYGPQGLKDAMDAQGYHLQYLLYTVALHRWLGRRIAGYDYERHFGGVFYLFVRGVRPAWAPAGIYFDRPSLDVVTQLDAALGGSP